MNDKFWWVLTKTRSTHGTHVPWLPGIWWRFNDSRLMTSGLFFCWQERDDTYGIWWWALPCLCPGNLKQNYVRYSGVTDIIAVGSMTCATSWQLKAPDLTQSWGERRDWQQPRYSPCRTPELLAGKWWSFLVTRWWPFWGKPLLRYIDRTSNRHKFRWHMALRRRSWYLGVVSTCDSSWASYK